MIYRWLGLKIIWKRMQNAMLALIKFLMRHPDYSFQLMAVVPLKNIVMIYAIKKLQALPMLIPLRLLK